MGETQQNGLPRGMAGAVVAIIAAGAAVPLLAYWLLFGRIASVTPQEAKVLLRQDGALAELVDVRPPQVFAAGHIEGAVNWPLEQALAAEDRQGVPDRLRGKTLLLVCDVGLASRLAAWHLDRIGVQQGLNVRGGIQEWTRDAAEAMGRRPAGPEEIRQRLTSAEPPRGDRFDRWCGAGFQGAGKRQVGNLPHDVGEFPFRRSPLVEQAVAVLAFFVIKPIYTLLALGVVIVLWKSRAPDLAALRWAMIFFFVGENICAVNYFVFKETSYLCEYFHSLGMLVRFGFVVFAVLEGVDRRVLMLSDPGEKGTGPICAQHPPGGHQPQAGRGKLDLSPFPRRCAALGLCGQCIKYADVPCGLRRTFYVLIPALIVLALMLPTADWQDNSYNTWVFGQLYNYGHLRVYQQFENWYCAAVAVVMLVASLAILILKRDHALAWAKLTFAAGAGPLGFGMLRMVLGGAYDQNRVWYLFWEETTELLFIAATCFVLWTFRRGLRLGILNLRV